ncbi:MAG: hypothetical protein M1587_08840 [Thaumarchaeota archaeon]|nr:hypothetical protein [Nitrososphaerota archaeon]MDG6908100.1 hypothetical protein [Nitrososphaerota archaeon]
MDSAKLKKLEEYVAYLIKKGADEEKSESYEDAIPTYLKLVDVLLLMADAAPSHPYWLKCTDAAEAHQKKIRTLIAKASMKQQATQS